MKPENENAKYNITRLVKRTRQEPRPTKAFTDALIDAALQELDLSNPDQTQSGGKTTMKRTSFARKIGYAATLLLVFGLAIFFFLPRTNSLRLRNTAVSLSTADPKVNSLEQQMPQDSSRPRPKFIGTPTSQTRQNAGGPSLTSSRERIAGDSYSAASPLPMAHGGTTPPNGESVDAMFFQNYGVNPFVDTEDDRLSTFAADTDSASYAMARQYLQNGNRVPKDAVRVEEFVNAFDYAYPAPSEGDFTIHMEACAWPFEDARKNSHLLRIALKTRELSPDQRKPAILTFVIDVSGSMQRENRLGLVKQSLRMLVDQLHPNDQIGIAVYGSQGRRHMDHKSVAQRASIISAIESLHSEGSTNAEEGIRIGYDMANEAFRPGWINRVVLCSDGVANVGRTGPKAILAMIQDKADRGITLSALGFGMGNYNDVLLEQLGNKGNGYYAYIDTLNQAKALFEDNLVGTLQVIARDVKIQVDFDPKTVRSYRLIGYENRAVPDHKFRDDTYDGGEIGAGHSTTALYEVKLWDEASGPLATTFVRYKDADTFKAGEFSMPFSTHQIQAHFIDTSAQFRLAATAAQFAELLRESYWAKGQRIEPILAQAATLTNDFDYHPQVVELLDLMSKARKVYNLNPSTSNTND